MKKSFILSATILSFLMLANFVLAQGGATEQTSEDVKLDTTISAEDLGVKKASVLPGSPFYGFKNIFRGVRSSLIFNPVKKAEYRLQVSNEKMVEARQLIEEKDTDKARQLASRTIEDANKDLDGIVKQGDNFKKQLKTAQAPSVNKFLDKLADHSLKQQVLLQKLEEKVPEQAFAKIEQSRQRHLENFGQVMTRVAQNPQETQERFSKVVGERQGSDFKELKAIEILRDLEDKVSPEAKEALKFAQERLSQNFEQRFTSIPQEAREQKLSEYVEFLPGNPVRQFEALDRMKQSFHSADTVSALEIGKDKAVRKFENQFNQFTNDQARADFMEPWRNGDPESLRTMTEMQMRVDAPEQFQPFHQEAIENFKDKLEANPEAFKNDPFFQKMTERPDIVDLQFSKELNPVMQEQVARKFIQNIQQPQAAQKPYFMGPPVRQGLEVLKEIKQGLPSQAQQGINQAINEQNRTVQRFIQRKQEINQPVQPLTPRFPEPSFMQPEMIEPKPIIEQVEPLPSFQEPIIEPKPIIEPQPVSPPSSQNLFQNFLGDASRALIGLDY